MKKLALILFCALSVNAFAENGYNLWLRYSPISNEAVKNEYLTSLSSIAVKTEPESKQAIEKELNTAIKSMLPEISNANGHTKLFILSAKETQDVSTNFKPYLPSLDNEGYCIIDTTINNQAAIYIIANTGKGCVYGTFRLLNLVQEEKSLKNIHLQSVPKIKYRMLNHWDNPDGSVERGYAGKSLWYGKTKVSEQRLIDYARANASIGINSVVINNVNASPAMMNEDNIKYAAYLAKLFRPYGIQLFMSINFSSPKNLGGLKNSDPLDSEAINWWSNKAKEIYSQIPDFGGFLVKANSEGLPGPQQYGRTHADGANMLAKCLEPYGGIVIWRAFVYDATGTDRAMQAYNEFMPLDGKFRPNVVVQIKNGAVDFQPREPFHPLFGAMKNTKMALELQITQEYLGFSDHLVYLAPLYSEVLNANTYATTANSLVADIISKKSSENDITVMAGVSNIGNDTNWCGHHFGQANWYAFGRLAWNPYETSENIADDWVKLTFGNNPQIDTPIKQMMMASREACVEYMTPMGLHHLMGYDHHHGPQPWLDTAGRADWNSIYYHKADKYGIGFDRSTEGSGAVLQYNKPLSDIFDNTKTCPLNLQLWFHHIGWKDTLSTNRILWDELCFQYNDGVEKVKEMQKIWISLSPNFDKERYTEVRNKLDLQLKEATWWRNACLLYFQTFSNMPFPSYLDLKGENLSKYQDKHYKP